MSILIRIIAYRRKTVVNKRIIPLSFFISLVLLSSTFMAFQNTVVIEDAQSVSVIQEKVVDRFQPAYEDHAPISIVGNGNLTVIAEAEAWAGNGTLEDPFIIEEYNITLSGTGSCIALYNISLYLVIRDCLLGDGDYGIYLENVTHFSSIGNTISGNDNGIFFKNCDHSVVTTTTFIQSVYHLVLNDTINMHIEDCIFESSFVAIIAQLLAYSWILKNTFSDSDYGIYFSVACVGNEIRQNSFSEILFEGVLLTAGVSGTKVVWNYFGGYMDGAGDYSSPSSNEFSHNYYFGFTSLDLDNDGIYDYSHPIIGPSGLRDYSPLRYPPLPPSWTHVPDDFEIELGSSCFHQLEVNSYPPIAHWVVNDTIHFEIDHNGVLLDRGNLMLGEYGFEVNVTDLYGQSVTGIFTVTVVDTTYPVFVTTPNDVIFYYGEDVSILLIVWDNNGIGEWTLSDTSNFTFTWDSYGELNIATIESVGSLEPGSYPLHLTAYDHSGLMVAASFTVTVERIPDEGAPLILILVPSGLAGVAIVLGILSLLRTRKEK
jgi:parallel beta-helix repeat protein